MPSFKSHPVFYTSLLVMGAVSAGAAWLNFSQRGEISRLRTLIDQQSGELSGYASSMPFPSRENVAAVEQDRKTIEALRDEIRRSLSAKSELAETLAAAPIPGSPTDAYFDIANFVERVRETAAAAGVLVSPENRLGFAAYASTGPDREIIPLVFRQRQQVDYLLGLLITARPREIVSVQRQQPLTATQRQQIEEALASGQPRPTFASGAQDAGDYFDINPMVSAAKPGFIETNAFRLTFDGTSASLRILLNALAKFELPVVVRSVEVESLTRSDGGGRPPPRRPESQVFGGFGNAPEGGTSEAGQVELVKPLVEQNDSRFVVTVEFVSLVDPNAEPVESSEVQSAPANEAPNLAY